MGRSQRGEIEICSRWSHDCDKLAVVAMDYLDVLGTGIYPLLLTAACLRAGGVGAHSIIGRRCKFLQAG